MKDNDSGQKKFSNYDLEMWTEDHGIHGAAGSALHPFIGWCGVEEDYTLADIREVCKKWGRQIRRGSEVTIFWEITDWDDTVIEEGEHVVERIDDKD